MHGIGSATGNILSRHTGYDANVTRAVLQACARVCEACGDDCEQHAGMHEHCRICAEACRRCEQACNELLTFLADRRLPCRGRRARHLQGVQGNSDQPQYRFMCSQSCRSPQGMKAEGRQLVRGSFETEVSASAPS